MQLGEHAPLSHHRRQRGCMFSIRMKGKVCGWIGKAVSSVWRCALCGGLIHPSDERAPAAWCARCGQASKGMRDGRGLSLSQQSRLYPAPERSSTRATEHILLLQRSNDVFDVSPVAGPSPAEVVTPDGEISSSARTTSRLDPINEVGHHLGLLALGLRQQNQIDVDQLSHREKGNRMGRRGVPRPPTTRRKIQ